MRRFTERVFHLHLLVLAALLSSPAVAAEQGTAFRVTLDADVAQRPITGSLYVFVHERARPAPRLGPNWFDPEPFFRLDVKDFRPGTERTVDDRAAGFPDVLSKLPAGTYHAQAVLDHSFYEPSPGNAPGNFHSPIAEVVIDPDDGRTFELTLDEVVPERPFPETKHVREVLHKSELLSKFHGREVLQRAGVVLPESYFDQPRRRFPVMYIVPGFGGSHRQALRYADDPPGAGPGEVEFIRVVLNGHSEWGHHTFTDSATNGPRGQALIEELIPYLDRKFRTVAAPTARFLTGHSSGGWTTLWLQVTYPETFGGCWSSAPDPVDFREWQGVDLYADPPQNMYRDEDGNRRPIARRGRVPVLWYDSFTRMDDVLGRGGQLRSFEAVFSPLDEEGLPKRMYDRDSGRVKPEVVEAWKEHDIRLKLQENWEQLEPKLRGKLHIVCGTLDTFYLYAAVERLGKTLEQLGSDADVKLVEGGSHGSILTPELYARFRREMSAAFRKHHAKD